MTDDQSSHDWALTETGQDGKRAGAAAPPAGQDPALSGPAVAGQPSAGGSAAGSPGSDADAAPGSSAHPDEDPEAAPPGRSKHRSFWRELPVLIVIALVIALLIKSFVVQAFFIPSPSMEQTLDVGDKVLVNKLVYHFRSIQPGDIVVFNGAGSWNPVPAPSSRSSDPLVRLYDKALLPLFRSIIGLFGTAPGQQDYIKRVIGVPGDHVACCTSGGLITVNGVPLHEKSYLYPGNVPSTSHFSVTVPPGRLWVMGDHRFVSYDSRGHMSFPGGGTVPESQVVGRAFMIVWPPSRWRVLPIPATFGQPGIDGGKSAATALAVAGQAVAVTPTAPFLPVEIGFAGALPLTFLQRRLRRRMHARRCRRASR
jgi:signal peptidase I